jgi:DNA repair protein SbcD/Mre11
MENSERSDLIFIGDVHLGRRPVALDAALERLGPSARDFSPAAALASAIDDALRNPPRAVVFAGDLVDSEDDQFEAFSILEREVRQLSDAEIPVFAVAGNHDGLVLPKLVARVPGAHLLGVGGRWERVEVPGTGQPLDLFGWSFPTRHETACPLDKGEFEACQDGMRPGAIGLGVLHCDLDSTASRYAPVSRARLEATRMGAWFLGHVHAPSDLSGVRPIGYLGSLVGLDAGEPGRRGPWRVRIEDGAVHAEQLELGPIRWERLEIELVEGDAVDANSVHTRIHAVVNERLEADTSFDSSRCRLVAVRVDLVGNLKTRDGARELVADRNELPFHFKAAGTTVIVQRVQDATRSAVDLLKLAEEPTPIGRVASRLIALRDSDDQELVDKAKRVITRVRGNWGVNDEDYPLPESRVLLERAGWRLLNLMLDDRREAQA